MSSPVIPPKAKLLHRHMYVELNKQIAKGTDEYEHFQCMAKGYLGNGVVQKCSSTIDLMDKLETAAIIEIGKYDVLKDILRQAGLDGSLGIVTKTENAVKEIYPVRQAEDQLADPRLPSTSIISQTQRKIPVVVEQEPDDDHTGREAMVETDQSRNTERYRNFRARLQHHRFIVWLNKEMSDEHYQDFKQLCRSLWSKNGVLDACIHPMDLLNRMQNAKILDVGKYVYLKELLEDFPDCRYYHRLIQLEKNVKEILQGATPVSPYERFFKTTEDGKVTAAMSLIMAQNGEIVDSLSDEQESEVLKGAAEMIGQRGCKVLSTEVGSYIMVVEFPSLEAFLSIWIQCIDMVLVSSLRPLFDKKLSGIRLMLNMEMTEDNYCAAISTLGDKFLRRDQVDKTEGEKIISYLSDLLDLIKMGDFDQILQDIQQLISEIGSRLQRYDAGVETIAITAPIASPADTEPVVKKVRLETLPIASPADTEPVVKKVRLETLGGTWEAATSSLTSYEHSLPSQQYGGTQSMPATGESQPVITIRENSAKFQSYCRSITAGIFVETELCKMSMSAIQNVNSLLLVGGSGDGKSSILYHLVANPLPGYLPIHCTTPEEVQRCIDTVQGTVIKFLFIIDAWCGVLYIMQNLLDAWIDSCESQTWERYLTDHKFVFATSQTVWAGCYVHLGAHKCFRKVVEVTSRGLSGVDKRNMLQAHLKDHMGRLSSTETDSIVDDINPIAFGQCCRLMSEAIENHDLSGKDLTVIFQQPYRYLQFQLEQLRDKEKMQYAILSLIMLCGGKVNCEELVGLLDEATVDVKNIIEHVLDDCGCTGQTIGGLQECAEKLTGTWLEKVQIDGSHGLRSEVYTISHDSMYESVTISYGNHHFLHLLKFVTSDIIVQMVRPQNFNNTNIGQPELNITVQEQHYKDLVPIFTEKAMRGGRHLREVFDNPCVKEDRFQYFWCDYLMSNPDKLSSFRQSSNQIHLRGLCILFYAARSGSTLLKLLEENRDPCDPRCCEGNCALSGAVSGNNIKLVGLICSSDKVTGYQANNAALRALRLQHYIDVDIWDILLPKLNTKDVSIILTECLLKPCSNAHMDTVERMMQCVDRMGL